MLKGIKDGIEAGKNVLGILRWFKDVESRLNEIASQEEIMNLRELLNCLREERIREREENIELKENVQKLELILQQRDEYYFNEKEGVIRKKNSINGRDYAYCPQCFFGDDKVVPLPETDSTEKQRWLCMVCKWNGRSNDAHKRIKGAGVCDSRDLVTKVNYSEMEGAVVCDSRDLVTKVNYSEMSIKEVARDSNC